MAYWLYDSETGFARRYLKSGKFGKPVKAPTAIVRATLCYCERGFRRRATDAYCQKCGGYIGRAIGHQQSP